MLDSNLGRKDNTASGQEAGNKRKSACGLDRMESIVPLKQQDPCQSSYQCPVCHIEGGQGKEVGTAWAGCLLLPIL